MAFNWAIELIQVEILQYPKQTNKYNFRFRQIIYLEIEQNNEIE